VKFQKNKGGRK